MEISIKQMIKVTDKYKKYTRLKATILKSVKKLYIMHKMLK